MTKAPRQPAARGADKVAGGGDARVDGRLPVGPQIYRQLRRRIIRGDLEPGARITEAELALDYGVSRQPVREAFIKLAEEALVEVRPQRGTFVRKITVAAVLDAQFIRTAIEVEIARLRARQASDTLIAELRAQVAEQSRAARQDPGRFFDLDDRFHRTLAAAAGNSYAWSVVEGIKAQMDRVRHLSTRRFPVMRLVEQHAAIVDAIAAGDTARAEAAVRDHLSAILTDLPAIVASNPACFEDPDTAPAPQKPPRARKTP